MCDRGSSSCRLPGRHAPYDSHLHLQVGLRLTPVPLPRHGTLHRAARAPEPDLRPTQAVSFATTPEDDFCALEKAARAVNYEFRRSSIALRRRRILFPDLPINGCQTTTNRS